MTPFLISYAVFLALNVSPSGACSTLLLPSGKCCVFPFEYNGRLYNTCSTAGSLGKPWCATSANFSQDGDWGYCEWQQGWCSPGWYQINNRCVFVSPIQSHYYDDDDGGHRWNNARKACNEKGAELMMPRSLHSLSALLFLHQTSGFLYRRRLFLGSRENFNLQWKWLNEVMISPDLWGKAEPSPEDKRCGVIENFEKRWFQRGCGWWLASKMCGRFKRAYICEKLPVNNTCEQGYTFITERCYIIKTRYRLLWEDAEWDCERNHGYLAIIDTRKKFDQLVSLIESKTSAPLFNIGLLRDLSRWLWLDGTSLDSSLFDTGYPTRTDQGETCIAAHRLLPVIVNVPCSESCGYACESIEGNVAYKSLTQNSSVATGSNSSFAVDNNLTTCFYSEKESDPWLKIQLPKEFSIYKVRIENMKNLTNERPLTLSVWSRDRGDFGPRLYCKKNELYGPNLEYDCFPPVKGEFLLVKVPHGVNTTLVLCLVTVLGLESVTNASGVLREVWYTGSEDDGGSPDILRKWDLFKSQRKFWNVIQTMDAPSNFGSYYAQKLSVYMKVNESGNHTFYMTCDQECELWIYDIGDLNNSSSSGFDATMEPKILIKLNDNNRLQPLEWERVPSKQTSKPTFLSRCRLYGIEVYMRETVLMDHLSVGIKFPNGHEEKPMKDNNLFWLKTGERHLKFGNIRFHPGNQFSAEIGSLMSITGSYNYCCQGMFCPDCNLKVFIAILNNTYTLNSSLPMDCRENVFNLSLHADTPPGKYSIGAHYSFFDENFTMHHELAWVSVTAAILNECSFLSGFCNWKSSLLQGLSWNTGGANKGTYLAGASKANLESPVLPWKDAYSRTFTCLQFNYSLLDKTSGSSLEIYVGTKNNLTLLWKLRGYHGNKTSKAHISWESRRGVGVVMKGEGMNNATVAVVILDVKISTKYCSLSPVFAMPGHTCGEEEFKCENLQCVKKTTKCDGINNCLDGSDEKNCKCLNQQFTCSSGDCLSPEKLRDGTKDCPNGEDEKETKENKNEFQCFDGKFLPWSQTCKETGGCFDETHLPSICGGKACPLNYLDCLKQRGLQDDENESICRIPFKGPCDFQTGLCGLTHDSNSEFQWTIGRGPTPSEHTGPSFDHTTLSKQGLYLYLEASNRQDGDRARLQSEWFVLKQDLCFQFWYHMYGKEIGSLSIYIQIKGSETRLWSQKGNIGDRWIYAQVPITERRSFRVIIEGVVRGGSSGDMGIDDVNLINGHCPKVEKQESYDCFFDDGPCGWIGDQEWKIRYSNRRGNFLSFKTDSSAKITKTLTTRDLEPEGKFQCLRFWYFIGEDRRSHSNHVTTKLYVQTFYPGTNNAIPLWSTSYRTDRWVYVQIPLSQNFSRISFIATLQSPQPIFLAVDDISFSMESCKRIPNAGDEDPCSVLTLYNTCCKFPFIYLKTEYYSCTPEENDRYWCYDRNDFYGACQDICMWMTEEGECCSFPFTYKKTTYSTCITTQDRPRPWCPTTFHYDAINYTWGYCRDYCGLNRELCQWKTFHGDNTWKTVSRQERMAWKKLVEADSQLHQEQNNFEVLLPKAMFGNITIDNTIDEDLESFTLCLWLQRNGSAIEVKYTTKSGCGELISIGILFGRTVTITILGYQWDSPLYLVGEGWHHLCVSWLKFGGLMRTYLDGKKWNSIYDFSIDAISIKAGGVLTVSCSDVGNSSGDIVGRISELNMWEALLDEEEMQRMSLGCTRREGDLKSWTSLLSALKGAATVNYISSCQDTAGDGLAAASSSSTHGETPVRVMSPWYNRSTEGDGRCLKFRYMQLGKGKNTLILYQRNNIYPKERPIWEVQSTDETTWQYGQVSVSGVTEHQLIFEANLKQSLTFISIGGLYFSKGYCSTEPKGATKGCKEHLTNKSDFILSPYYPGYYPNDSWCEWRVTVPSGHVIQLEFLQFQLESEPRCLNDYVEVFDGKSIHSPSLGRFCGYTYPEKLESSSAELLVVFKSNHRIVSAGFKAKYYARKVKEEKYEAKQECPVGFTCYRIKENQIQYVLQGAAYVENIPKNISSTTTILLLGGSKLTRILDGELTYLSSLIYVDLSHNKIFQLQSKSLHNLSSLETLRMNNNFLKDLDKDFTGLHRLKSLDLSENLLSEISEHTLEGLSNLEILSLRYNDIRHIPKMVFKDTKRLTHLYLDHNAISSIEENAFASLARLKSLYLNKNRIKRLTRSVFTGLASLETLLLHDNKFVENEIATDAFNELASLQKLTMDSFILCCYAKKAKEGLTCDSPKNEFSSCEDMMKNPAVCVCIWILGIVALVGNLFVIIWRLVYNEDSKIQSCLFTNLAVSDFLMGVYLIIIAIQDSRWQGEYFKHDVVWRASALCQVTGALSMLSSEVSVILLTIITADRFICILFGLRVRRLTLKACYVLCSIAWLLGLFLSFLPMSDLKYFNNSDEGIRFYGRSAVCLALQLSSDRPPGWEYSVAIFIGFNLLAFIFISFAYTAIFWSALKSSSAIRSTNAKRESALAKRVAFIILTDFCCWMPVIIVGILSLTGNFYDPEKQVYVWVAVFVLPVNSSVNPILYTLATPQVRKWFSKYRPKTKGEKTTQERPEGNTNPAFSSDSSSTQGQAFTSILSSSKATMGNAASKVQEDCFPLKTNKGQVLLDDCSTKEDSIDAYKEYDTHL